MHVVVAGDVDPVSAEAIDDQSADGRAVPAEREPVGSRPAPVPFNSISGVPAKSGSVVPSMITAPVIVGRALVSEMVWPPATSGAAMLKVIVSVPAKALASRIACRNDPAPELLVLVTVNVFSKPSQSSCIGPLTATSGLDAARGVFQVPVAAQRLVCPVSSVLAATSAAGQRGQRFQQRLAVRGGGQVAAVEQAGPHRSPASWPSRRCGPRRRPGCRRPARCCPA